MLKINEIFYDLEGEGKYQGYPTLFIRLAGCNLRCKWCDTKYAYFKGKNTGLNALIQTVKKSPYRNINITGGEPLCFKKEVVYLIKEVKKLEGSKVQRFKSSKVKHMISVETNGSLSIAGVPADNISMDLKLPSSGEEKKMMMSNLRLLRPKDQLKLVIGSQKDMEYAKSTLAKYKMKAPVFAQPVYKKFPLKKIKEFVMRNKLNWKVSIQLHKLISQKPKAKSSTK